LKTKNFSLIFLFARENCPLLGEQQTEKSGFSFGHYIAFLNRPSSIIAGKLPFKDVISKGENLKGLDLLLVPAAQQSFDVMLSGADYLKIFYKYTNSDVSSL
jgi:hypothetical protein